MGNNALVFIWILIQSQLILEVLQRSSFYYYYGKNRDVFYHRKGNKTPADLKSLNLLS